MYKLCTLILLQSRKTRCIFYCTQTCAWQAENLLSDCILSAAVSCNGRDSCSGNRIKNQSEVLQVLNSYHLKFPLNKGYVLMSKALESSQVHSDCTLLFYRSWQANSLSPVQQFPRPLWQLKIHYCIHNSPPLKPILRACWM